MKLPITPLHWRADDCFNAVCVTVWLVHEHGGHYATHQAAGDNQRLHDTEGGSAVL